MLSNIHLACDYSYIGGEVIVETSCGQSHMSKEVKEGLDGIISKTFKDEISELKRLREIELKAVKERQNLLKDMKYKFKDNLSDFEDENPELFL